MERSATRRAFTALLVCLMLCVSSPLERGDEAGSWADEVALLQEGESHDSSKDSGATAVAEAVAMVRADKTADEHIAIADAAHHAAVPAQPEDQPEDSRKDEAAKQEQEQAPPQPAIQQTLASTSFGTHGAAWHCEHCSSTCGTQKCRDWCQQSWCKQDSPLFTNTAVPSSAGNQWHCKHCRSVCQTERCDSWCKKLWCPVDADGNFDSRFGKGKRFGRHGKNGYGHRKNDVRIHGGKHKMELLTLSTKTGSPKLVAMEKNANKMISLSNKDITGKMLRASSNAVEGVLKQREIEEEQFKERETKANEADQKRYSKSRYRKWKNQKDASEDANADQEVSEAKERTQEDNTKEIKYKTESNQGQEATKDLEKKIEKENAKFERQEKVTGGHKLPVTKPAWLP